MSHLGRDLACQSMSPESLADSIQSLCRQFSWYLENVNLLLQTPPRMQLGLFHFNRWMYRFSHHLKLTHTATHIDTVHMLDIII